MIPQLLSDAPNLSVRMAELGYEAARPERPGVWSPISQRDRDIHDRDSVDLYRLLLSIAPEHAAGVFVRGIADTRIGEAVSLGRDYLIEILTNDATAASMVADAWGAPSREAEIQAQIDRWRFGFAG